MKISFLCFDLSDNSLGRAALLAKAASKDHEVELIGPIKASGLWEPMKDLDLPIKSFPWGRFPSFAGTMKKMAAAVEGDVMVACKLRMASYGVGLMARKINGKPLLVDIDDWELGFFLRANFWGRLGRMLNWSNPNGMPSAWLMERWVARADGVFVSNRFLQKRFGGDMIYHCRDTEILDPDRFDSNAIKRRLGLEGFKTIMFLGTPRAHKGVEDLIQCMRFVEDPKARLVIVGAGSELEEILERYPEVKDRVKVFPRIPFSELPDYLSAGDIAAIPQRHTSDTVGQMPAKIFDAMAMAKPIVSTRVSDIPDVLGGFGYLVEPGNVRGLAEALNYIISHPEEARQMGANARRRCQENFDIRILREQLMECVGKAGGKIR
ncbi:MAG: glycosyltransferase family 4 protein [Candidatus Nitrohelix vancouverensis]|uniref:Glycosyltransferase family 4 protein n=1 Tax=Candidatus Nitrohelix vancouverensis TaxID=2705534 RepID=A0A7T0G3B7_9BACT|nr:MAG: glycosyltransferase family 4 protein [Candidatus Nitrohelix vancouverensis]